MSPTHPLENLSRLGGSLKPEPPDTAEIAGLLRTLGLGPEVWRVLDLCHNKRNLGEYEGLLEVDERLVKDLIVATQKVADALGTA